MGCNCKESNTKCNCDCPPNEPGPAGLNWVYATTVEAPGANCVYGGHLIQGGPDTDNDGLPNQILNSFYVCNGAPSSQHVIKVTAESAGANCANGGVKIMTGIDADADGIPDSEIQTSYLCNVSDGADGEAATITAGTLTTVPYGDPLTMDVNEISPGVFAIDMEVPEGPPGTTDADEIVVSGISPGCMSTELSGATTVTDYFNALISKICSMSAGIASKVYAFQGVLNRQITPTEISSGVITDTDEYFYIPFPDDSVQGYDNGNNFFTDVFRAITGMPAMRFAAENLIFQGSDPAPAVPRTGLFQIAIVEKGVTPTVDVVHASVNISFSNDQDGTVSLNSLLTGSITTVDGKYYSVRIRGGDANGNLMLTNGEFVINEGGKFSNNY